jgi:hypothetical protein
MRRGRLTLSPTHPLTLSLVAAATLLLPTPAPAQQPPAPNVRPHATGRVPQSVLDDFMAGFGGDKAALDRAVTAAGQIVQADPANAEALAWRSAGLGAQSGTAFQSGNFQEGMRLWQDSTSGLNQAVDMEPDNSQIRFVRGKSMVESSLYDPNPARSGDNARIAIGDLELALSSFDDVQKQLPKQTREEFYSWLLQASEKAGDKERVEKYKKLAGDKAGSAEERLAESAKNSSTGEALRSALAILDTDLAKALKPDLTAGLRDPARLDAALATLKQRLEAAPGDGPATAWHGFVRTLQASALNTKGKADDASKMWQEAVGEITKAAANDPANAEIFVLRGLTTLDRARQADAESRPGVARTAASDLDRAQRLLADANKPLPANAAAELNIALARAWYFAGEKPKVKACLETAVSSGADEKTVGRARDYLQKLK